MGARHGVLTLGDTVCALDMPLADLCPLCMWQQEATSFAESPSIFNNNIGASISWAPGMGC